MTTGHGARWAPLRLRSMAGMSALLSAAALALLLLSAAPAWAEQRVALVIGNGTYAHAPSLANPLNDATDVGAALDRLGFKVTRIENAGYSELRRGLQQFALAASASEVAVVFYAGHGIEVDRRNFLVPVDARLLSDADVEFEAVPLDLLSRAVERARGLRLIVLDACRDNPFAAAMQRAGGTRSIGRGLARIEPSGETLVAYAAKEGTVAADGEGRNSPYTEALLAHLEEPGLEVGLMFRKVRDAVLAETGGRQEPFVYGSLSSEGAYLAARPEPKPEPEPAPAPVTVQGGEDPQNPDQDQVVERRISAEKELLFWESVKDSEHAADFEAYLEQFPGGTYEALARNRLARLTRPEDTPEARVVETPDEPEPEVSPEPLAPTLESLEAALGLSREERRRIQEGLAALGFDPGPADGLFGQRTRHALSSWQSSQDLEATGYLDAESARSLLAADARALDHLTPKCSELGGHHIGENHAACWEEMNSRPRCHVWNAHYHSDRTADWNGPCERGMANGSGAYTLSSGSEHKRMTATGIMEGGKLEGNWIVTFGDGDRYQGAIRDGKRHGQGTAIFSSGSRYEGSWRNDRPDGWGVYTSKSGGEYEGVWEEGCFTRSDGHGASVNTTREACGFDQPNSCRYANDGMCDEPGLCQPGTDTTDCSGARGGANSCRYANDGTCDEPRFCDPGTDAADCSRARSEVNSCRYANDGMCDEPGLCQPGTDTTDCSGARGGANSCRYANDGTCDEPRFCDPGTDAADCSRARSEVNSCRLAYNGMCDEPGLCQPGTDTTDCSGARGGANSCRYANDGTCDEPRFCDPGTDAADCSRARSEVNSCRLAYNGICDEPRFCRPGTDTADCG